MKRISFLAIFFVIASLGAIHAQQRTGFAYYDLDRLYDTIPSLFYDDTDYTPEGRLRWTDERYRTKVERAGAVIGRMAMPLAGVYGVENEKVVKDLIRASDLPYSYVHRTLNTLDGMDFALLYYADRFFTERIETGYGYLCVEGTLDGKPTAVLLTRGDRYAAELLEELRERTPGIRILCAGKLPSGTAEKLSLRDALAPAERRGRGNAYARGGWWLHDRILTDTALTVIRADVFARRDLLDPRSETPLPTYRRQRYTGGIGRYFPIFLYIK
ncbi:hypothetical protein [Alistipes putredinis]|uniref:endonuclease/exonuclease/phosphatase family protein n=1 Tax=Alistipes putredinis TaxID=28117 RepID=UPI003AABC42D